MNLLLIAIGGAFGAIVRFFCVKLFINLKFLPNFAGISSNIILVNIIGSFLFGLLLYLGKNFNFPESFKNFIFIGFLASFTTYSTFIYELAYLFNQKQFFYGLTYLLTSLFIPLLLMIFFVIKI